MLVTSPRRDSIDEAVFFADRIADHGLRVDALVANRVHPAFAAGADVERLRGVATAVRDAGAAEPGPEADAAARRTAERLATLADLAEIAARERAALDRVAQRTGAPGVVVVPLLAHDVHDVAALRAVGRALTGPAN